MEKETKKVKPLVTSRVLFISVLDKIYLVLLAIVLLGLTITNFAGDISSPYYGFWARIGTEIVILIIVFIWYLILNWFYRCAVKTILCLTDKQVYKESYVPFKRTETSIPLDKITKVSTFTVFWIFRSVIIHQYHQLPLVFFTWNHQEFKDKLENLITKEKDKIENEYEGKNIITKERLKLLKYAGIFLAGLIVLVGAIKLFNFIFNNEVKVEGTYSSYSDKIVLNEDGSCDIDDISYYDVTDCEWRINSDEDMVIIKYEYEYWYNTKEKTIYLDYNAKKGTLTYDGYTYKK